MTRGFAGARPLRRPSQPRGRVGDHWSVEPSSGRPGDGASGEFPVIVSLDLEATGLSASVDHVIEIGAVKFRGTTSWGATTPWSTRGCGCRR